MWAKETITRVKFGMTAFGLLALCYAVSVFCNAQGIGVTPTPMVCGTSGQLIANVNGNCTGVTVNSPMAIVGNALTATQANSDWSAGSGVAQILNKPTNVSSFSDDAGYITASSLVPYLTMSSAAAQYFPIPSGTSLQYLNGVGSPVTFPPIVNYCYEGTTKHANCIPYFSSGVVSSGIITFQMTVDGTSGGAPLFPNGLIQSSVQIFCNNSTVPYAAGIALTNSNKTLTATVNSSSGAVTILTISVLAAFTAANGTTCNVQAMGY